MPVNQVDVVLVHGAWADGSSWSKVIGPLKAAGLTVVAASLPLSSLADDIVAVNRMLERLDGPVVLAGHAYGGAVIGETRDPKVASLVYIAGLWVLVAEYDRMINPETQLFQAERMGAHVRTRPVDHTPMVTAPADVVGIILDAARDVATPT
jgi:pimeloyl-ACP methyl ester carboxylesterase